MVMVRLMGGLGNQLFQYAAGRRLAQARGAELRLDLNFFAEQTKRRFLLGRLPLRAREATAAERMAFFPNHGWRRMAQAWRCRLTGQARPSILTERQFHFEPAVLRAADQTYLDGYWQSERYFAEIAESLRAELQPSVPAGCAEMLAKIAGGEAVSLHIRRGDYVSEARNTAVHGVLPLGYYHRAAARMAEELNEPHFFVFTDDPAWAMAELRLPWPVTMVTPATAGDELADLALMSRCRHHIIANSTFSWWGAWLNPSTTKRVLAPHPWFATAEMDARDLLPPAWELIDVAA